jgi:cytochrome b pre-mRNA-processing protein 3
MSLLERMFGQKKQREPLQPLYQAVVALARDAFWYREGQVPDTIDGRFDMVAAILALVLIRLEREDEAGGRPSVLLTEVFIDDMEGTLRQIGIGDQVVGNRVSKLMGALGGRLSAFRTAIAAGEGFEPSVTRNVFHDTPPSPEAVALVSARLRAIYAGVERIDFESILKGALTQP